MNRRLTQILIGSLLISALVASIPFIEHNFHIFSFFRDYALSYGGALFVCLLIISIAAIVSAVGLYRAKLSRSAAATMFVAILGVVAMCLPTQARSVQNYFSHEGQQTRLVNSVNAELSTDRRFEDIELTYWCGKGEGCSIYGSVQSKQDLAKLERIVSTKTGLWIDSKVEIIAQRDQSKRAQ